MYRVARSYYGIVNSCIEVKIEREKMGEVNVHMGHMGNARSIEKDQPTCFDQAKSKGGGKGQVGGGKDLGGSHVQHVGRSDLEVA